MSRIPKVGKPRAADPVGSCQTARNVGREARTLVDRFRSGKLSPVLMTAVRRDESWVLSQQITLRLDPIAGELISVFVPVQAMGARKYPDADFASLTVVIRATLLSGNPLFGVITERQLSMRCGVNSRSIGSAKRVSEMVKLGHNATVNYLRARKYVKATKLLFGNESVTPALILQTVLERMDGVLDPDDGINGAVQQDIPNMRLPVAGLGLSNKNPFSNVSAWETRAARPPAQS